MPSDKAMQAAREIGERHCIIINDTVLHVDLENVAEAIDTAIAEAVKEATGELVEALEKLARLGREPDYGNSTGNLIAQAAIATHHAKWEKGHE
jgi:hypothetical protein